MSLSGMYARYPVWVQSSSKSNTSSPRKKLHSEAHRIAYEHARGNPLRLPLHYDGVNLPFHSILIQIGEERMSGKPSQMLHRETQITNIQEKTLYDTKWPAQHLHEVDWPAIDQAMRSVSKPTRVRFTKRIHQLN